METDEYLHHLGQLQRTIDRHRESRASILTHLHKRSVIEKVKIRTLVEQRILELSKATGMTGDSGPTLVTIHNVQTGASRQEVRFQGRWRPEPGGPLHSRAFNNAAHMIQTIMPDMVESYWRLRYSGAARAHQGTWIELLDYLSLFAALEAGDSVSLPATIEPLAVTLFKETLRSAHERNPPKEPQVGQAPAAEDQPLTLPQGGSDAWPG